LNSFGGKKHVPLYIIHIVNISEKVEDKEISKRKEERDGTKRKANGRLKFGETLRPRKAAKVI
jgi:hypothetical protein